MKGRAIVSLALGLAVILLAAGCAPTGAPTGGPSGSTAASGTVPVTGMFGIVRDWSESTHAVPVTFAAEETGCVLCHDGRAFVMGVTDPKSFNASEPFGPYVVATDCRACHTGAAVDLLRSGMVTTPSSPQPIKAGLGALCIGCHRERTPAKIGQQPFFAPHPSVQAAVYLAYGGIRQPGVMYGSTVKHTQVENMCVGCHMSTDAGGVPTHTFLPPKDPRKICGKCHQGITTYNRKASGDYDGDGKVDGIQDEVTGLLNKLSAAAAKEMGADSLAQFQGRIVFKSGATTVTAPIPGKVYQAAYNWALVTNDKSLGIHNPKFTVTLLQQSYMTLTGAAVPNSKPFPGSTTATSSGTPSGTAPATGGATPGGAGTGTPNASGTTGTP